MLDARGDARGLGVALLDARRQNLQPPPKLSLSAWAGRYAVLSRETSAQTGRFKAFAYQTGAGVIYKYSVSCDRLLYPPRPLTHSGGAAAGRRCGGLQQERDCADAAGYAGFVRPCRRPESERQRADDSKEDVFQWRELNAGRCEFARWLSPDYRAAGAV